MVPRWGGTLGVLGGMGPLASAAFLRTIYDLHAGGPEQLLPRVLLDSDPGFPDRTEVIRSGGEREFAAHLQLRLEELRAAGVSRTVIACFTAHHFLPLVDPVTRATAVCLVDVTVDRLAARSGRFLLLATRGTRQARIFQNAPGWPAVADRVVLPGDDDQDLVHRIVYEMKRAGGSPQAVDVVDRLRRRYDCRGVIAGCTEFHLVSRELVDRCGPENVVDALRQIAVDVPRLLALDHGAA
ncbi:aspartate/glutamate racemase family protein [Saccharopolyspora pogona]|uniref:aspartate/glutamate racemase family protein n=1 Tax=Saccharopolyspora pogona TaxID=333966 RepID=UPI0016873757|nr:aspartate/glutamate racemase family protein [Saccharopolyspora pogona]